MKVCYIPADMDGPGFYRCLSPGRQLRDHGWDVFMPDREEPEVVETVKPLYDRQGNPIYIVLDGEEAAMTEIELRHHTKFKASFDLPKPADLYVFQQWKERVVNEAGIRQLRSFGMATTMDVDDNYIDIPDYNPAFLGTHPYKRNDGTILTREQRRRIQKNTKRTSKHGMAARMNAGLGIKSKTPPNSNNRLHMFESMKQVDLVTVSTPHLAEVYSKYNNNIKVIRNYVDWDIWSDIKPQYEVVRDRLRIGYLASYDYHKGDLGVLGDSVRRFLLDHPEVDFVTNNERTHAALGVPLEQRITIGEYEFYDHETGQYQVGERTACIDIGLVPLAMNDLNEGKSHLKGMEYSAAGIAYIASPTESYLYWRGEDRGESAGFLAETESEWYELMEYMLENHVKHGKAGRALARRHCIQENWREWADAYGELLGDESYKLARQSVTYGAVQKASELGPLLQIIKEARPKVIVEIGTARGGTFWAMAQSAPKDCLLISIDIPAGTAMDMRDGEDVYTGRDRNRLKQFIQEGQRLALIDMNSQLPAAEHALVHALGGKKIDVLFIDGDHTYKGVKHDYETYSKYLAPGGIAAFHDIIKHRDVRVGVDKFWHEAKRGKIYQEFFGPETWGYVPWGGIGVLHG